MGTGPQFCFICGGIIEELPIPYIECTNCKTVNPNEWYKRTEYSVSRKFPSILQTRNRRFESSAKESGETAKMIQVDCEKCDAKKVNWFEMQLRSADEGSTIFYNCLKCGHKWRQDN